MNHEIKKGYNNTVDTNTNYTNKALVLVTKNKAQQLSDMLPHATFSTAVTATTVAAFFLIVKNLEISEKENKSSSDGEGNLSNEALSSAILAELAAVEEESNEIDFELLEEQFKVIEAEESVKEEPTEINSVEEGDIPTTESLHSTENTAKNGASNADISIEVSHKLSNAGQHRPYILSLHFTPRPRGDKPIPWNECKLNFEWPLPKNVLIDVWSLRRLTPFTIESDSGHLMNPSSVSAGYPSWSVKPRHPDLEVGAYDPKARPFVLTAQIPFKTTASSGDLSRIENGKLVQIDAPWNLDLHVPDLFVRYQTAQRGNLFQKHANKVSYIPAPNLHFSCPEELQIDWQMDRLRPLKISLPVGSATPIVAHVTVASVLFSSIFLLVTILKF